MVLFFIHMEHTQENLGNFDELITLSSRLSATARFKEDIKKHLTAIIQGCEDPNEGLWYFNLTNGESYYSPSYFQMLGYDPRSMKQSHSTFLELLHPADKDQLFSFQADFLSSQNPDFEIEFRMRSKSGSYHWISSRGRSLSWDEKGMALIIVGLHRDISGMKKAYGLLCRAVVRLRAVILLFRKM